MKTAIVADIHANLATLRAFPQTPGIYDELWVTGGLVNFGVRQLQALVHSYADAYRANSSGRW